MSGGESESGNVPSPRSSSETRYSTYIKKLVEIKKAAASEILKVGKLRGGQKIQDAISKFLEELGNLLNQLNNAV